MSETDTAVKWRRILLGVVICAAVALAAVLIFWPQSGGGAPKGIRFGVWGDMRPATSDWPVAQSEGFTHMVRDLARRQIQWSISLGDYTYLSPTDDQATIDQKYDAFLKVAKPLLQKPVYWVVGNHELIDLGGSFAAAYHDKLGAPLPAYYLAQPAPGIHLVALSTMEKGLEARVGYYGEDDPRNSVQADWLVTTLNKLARQPDAWVLVALHHPIIDGKPFDPLYHSSESAALQKLFRKYGVDLVLEGDVHAYRRHVEPGAPVYLIQGTGGAPSLLEGAAPIDKYDAASAAGVFGYTVFSLVGGRLHGDSWEASPKDWRFKVVDSFPVPQRRVATSVTTR